jgi:hypothetical protein
MPRCPDCNKFVSLDSDQEPEINISVDDAGEVSGDASIANNCADCGTELTTASIDVAVGPDDMKGEHPVTGKEITLADYLTALRAEADEVEKEHGEAPEIEIEIENEEGERTSRTEGTGRRVRTFYGAKITGTVVVTYGERKFEASFEAEDDVQASSMDSSN